VTSAIQYKKDIKDEEIIRRIKQNDNRVWEILQVKYYKMLEIFVTKNSGSADDAWDNFQETMAALFVNVSKTNFRLTCAFKTYVYQINRNMWLAELKRQKRRPIRVYDNEDNEFADIDTSDEVVEKEHRIKLIEREIEMLGENCRKIIRLYYYLKKSMKEIALEIGYSNDANAKNQKAKCMKQLKTKLGHGRI